MKEVGEEEYSDSTSEVEEEEIDQEERDRLECAEIGGIEEMQPFEENEDLTDLISDFQRLGVRSNVKTYTQRSLNSTVY